GSVFFYQQLRRQFGGAVERAAARERECLADSCLGGPAVAAGARRQLETIATALERQLAQRSDRIHSAGGQEQQIAAVTPQIFEAVNGATEVGGNEIVRTFAVSGMCAWFRGAFNQEIDGPHRFEVLSRAHVTVMKVDTERTQPLDGKLTATPFQV